MNQNFDIEAHTKHYVSQPGFFLRTVHVPENDTHATEYHPPPSFRCRKESECRPKKSDLDNSYRLCSRDRTFRSRVDLLLPLPWQSRTCHLRSGSVVSIIYVFAKATTSLALSHPPYLIFDVDQIMLSMPTDTLVTKEQSNHVLHQRARCRTYPEALIYMALFLIALKA